MAQFSLKTNLNQAAEDANGGTIEPFSVNAFPEFGASINLPRVLDRRKTGEKMLRGIPVSQGVSRSQIVVLDRTRIDPAKSGILESELAGEENRLQVSLAETRQQILTMQERLREAMGAEEAQIFDDTLVVFGSGMSDGSSHSNRNLPVLLAGGGLKHQGHLVCPAEQHKRVPLSNLWLSVLHWFGSEADRFGRSTGTFSPMKIG